MKSIKLLLVVLTFTLLSSCASFQVRTVNYPVSQYAFNQYDYNSLHFLYVNNPNYFYDTYYIDQYGIRQYYYNHPYFIRYCNYRNITPVRPVVTVRPTIRRVNKNYTPSRRVRIASTRRSTIPVRRTNTVRRSTTRRTTNSTVRRQNMASRKKATKAKIRLTRRN